ncbi:MAG: FliM/FliN family flagellar motor switch protein [Parvularculaceae bacterium]
MREKSAEIIRKKMAASGRDPGPIHVVADLASRMAAAAPGAFAEMYGEKCQLIERTAASFCLFKEALAEHAGKSAIYHFRHNSETDFLVILDPETALRAAGWSLAASRELPDPKPESVSAIDRRLAKRIAVRAAELIFASADKAGVARGGVELIASGDDPRRFDFADDQAKSVTLALDAKTLEGEELGFFTIIAPEKIIVPMREYYATTAVEAAKKWKRDLRVIAATSPTKLRTVLTEQVIDIDRLVNLKPGDVIDLETATIEDVLVLPQIGNPSKLQILGSLGNRDGRRALRIKSAAF